MRTTIKLEDELLRKALMCAAEEGISLQALIDRALRAQIGRPRRGARYRLRWRTEKGRLRRGLRIEDRGAFFDLMNPFGGSL